MSNLQRRPCGLSKLGMVNDTVRLAALVEVRGGVEDAPIAPPPESATIQTVRAQLRDTRVSVAAMKRAARKRREARKRDR